MIDHKPKWNKVICQYRNCWSYRIYGTNSTRDF